MRDLRPGIGGHKTLLIFSSMLKNNSYITPFNRSSPTAQRGSSSDPTSHITPSKRHKLNNKELRIDLVLHALQQDLPAMASISVLSLQQSNRMMQLPEADFNGSIQATASLRNYHAYPVQLMCLFTLSGELQIKCHFITGILLPKPRPTDHGGNLNAESMHSIDPWDSTPASCYRKIHPPGTCLQQIEKENLDEWRRSRPERFICMSTWPE